MRLAIPLLLMASSLGAAADVIVYGGTPAGIAAACSAADQGSAVLLIEPTARLGGLVTSGLSHADFRTFESINGAYREFTNRVVEIYSLEYGADSRQVRECLRGTHAEPKVNLAAFEAMLAKRKSRITILKKTPIRSVELEGARILSLTSQDGLIHAAKVFIDATYEGDLMALSKVPYAIGREGRDEYGEPLAPAKADGQLQAYNFRLIATRVPENRAAVKAPEGYRREDYLGIIPLLRDGKFAGVFGKLGENSIYKAQEPPLPNSKYDLNDVSHGLVRLSLPGENSRWPEGSADERRRIFDDHLRWNVGLLYFLQNDPSVPSRYRDEASEWGWCRDEFTETDHLPPQLYVREARRMKGQHVFSQKDTRAAAGDARSVWHQDAIAIGDYGHNCHGTGRQGNRFDGRHTGEFYGPIAPYQIPYGVLVPRECPNLLVPVACSATHVGFCALRLEPIWMSLGEAAGIAAHLAQSMPVQSVAIEAIRKRLWSRGAATIYVSDVSPDHADFAAVQWWGTNGRLHGLHSALAKPGQRGKHLFSQYYEAFPGHSALDRVDPSTIRQQYQAWLADKK